MLALSIKRYCRVRLCNDYARAMVVYNRVSALRGMTERMKEIKKKRGFNEQQKNAAARAFSVSSKRQECSSGCFTFFPIFFENVNPNDARLVPASNLKERNDVQRRRDRKIFHSARQRHC